MYTRDSYSWGAHLYLKYWWVARQIQVVGCKRDDMTGSYMCLSVLSRLFCGLRCKVSESSEEAMSACQFGSCTHKLLLHPTLGVTSPEEHPKMVVFFPTNQSLQGQSEFTLGVNNLWTARWLNQVALHCCQRTYPSLLQCILLLMFLL